MAGKKINDLTALGRDLASTDLLELSLAGGTGSRKITGQQIINAIPSGITIGTTAITSGTVGRVLFEGTGNVVQESSSLFWDATNNRLGIGTSSPLTTFHLADSTTAVSLLARSSLIASTLVASANNDVLIGLDIQPTFNNGAFTGVSNLGIRLNSEFLVSNGKAFTTSSGATANTGGFAGGQFFAVGNNTNNGYTAIQTFYSGVSFNAPLSINASGGNVLIGTTTNAGFRLDVNGTARVQGNTTISLNQNGVTLINASNTTSGTASTAELRATTGGGFIGLGKYSASTNSYKFIASSDSYLYSATIGDIAIINDFASGRIKFGAGASSTAQATLFSTGNFAINTTTDAGFKLDVNGTARFSGTNYQVVLQTTSNGIIKAQGGYQNTDGSYTADGNLFLKAGIGGSGNLYITPNNGNTTAFGLFANGTGFNIGLGLSTVASASFQINSTTQGFLPPRMTTTQKNAIATPATGLMVYDNVLNRPCFYDGTTWITL